MSTTFHLLVPREAPKLVSLVVPIYNEEEVIPLLAARLSAVLERLACPVEIVLVNDGSTDFSLIALRELTRRDSRFRVLSLARNFGHQVAATAGLDAARGDAIVLMDADLQDPPELVLDMLAEYRKGYDVVYAQRTRRDGETVLKRWTAWAFYRLMRILVHPDLPVDTGDFRLVSRRCLDTLNQMREVHRFLRGMVSWVGFPQTAVRFVRPPRAAGMTKYPLRKMLRFAWTAAISFSPLPLRLSLAFGAMLFGVGIVYLLYTFARWLLGVPFLPGWTSLILLNCIGSGSILLAIGVLGEYVARIFEQMKARPLYIVSERFDSEDAREVSAGL